MTSSPREQKKPKLVNVDLVRRDGSHIRVPLLRSSMVNRLLRRVPKGQIKLKNMMGSCVVVPTRYVFVILVDGEERWRNQTAD